MGGSGSTVTATADLDDKGREELSVRDDLPPDEIEAAWGGCVILLL
jgi:hypothetical protein